MSAKALSGGGRGLSPSIFFANTTIRSLPQNSNIAGVFEIGSSSRKRMRGKELIIEINQQYSSW